MLLIIKNKSLCLLLIAAIGLVQGCANRQQTSDAVQRALDSELANNQEQFLNKPIADVLRAFQRQPTSISTLDKENNVVWLYDIYDRLIDPQTGKNIMRPNQLPFVDSKIHWQEYYYVNLDGIVYDIKVDAESF